MAHKYTHAMKKGMSQNEYVVIYCEKCGHISYDQAQSSYVDIAAFCFDENAINEGTPHEKPKEN